MYKDSLNPGLDLKLREISPPVYATSRPPTTQSKGAIPNLTKGIKSINQLIDPIIDQIIDSIINPIIDQIQPIDLINTIDPINPIETSSQRISK
ncbi:hypothetical protein BM1_04807 [Bipolaris maydis]|nr:hypothetical protein BM1_04807 [Bipolaris maydis]